MRILLSIVILTSLSLQAHASRITSEYSKLDTDKNCVFKKANNNDGSGASAKCTGLKGFSVHFSAGDLRQMVEFGYLGTKSRDWASFSQWNYTGKTIEWRLDNGRPVATILRWFIENIDANTGSASENLRGQVLVISKVGQPALYDACVVGYVDALSNRDANVMARDVADDVAPYFQCLSDRPKFYGKRGPHSGNPSGLNN